jgi:diguanylate cyclase (GGDEF)-like protein/PAS domain S-box-containing protein
MEYVIRGGSRQNRKSMTTSRSEPQSQANTTPTLWHLAGVAVILALLSYGAAWLNGASWGTESVSTLWPSTGFLLGVLLCLPRAQWAKYIAVGFVVDLAVNLTLALPETFAIAVYLALCNVLEVSLAALLLHRTISARPGFTRPRELSDLLIYGVILAPAVASLFASACLTGSFRWPLFHSFLGWFTGDALGIAIMTPLYLSFRNQPRTSRRSLLEVLSLSALLCCLSLLVFWQTSLPLLFVLFPCLLLLEVRLGLAGSAVGLLAVSVIGGYFTARGHGPIGLTHLTTLSSRILMLQFFIGVCMIVLYIVEVVIAERNRFELNLTASQGRFRLLAEGSSDIIMLMNLRGECQYVSPAVTKLLGWEPEEFLPLGYDQIVHPGDLAAVKQLLEECRVGQPLNTLIYRSKMKDGSYLWMEANLVLYRDPETQAPASFINVVRDISNRKAAEDRLSKALNAAENLASIDALTGVANRRSFDEFLETEWLRGIRARSDFSMLLADVDHFKLYNDKYGHVTGDNCLKEIAEAIGTVVHRSTDLLARYGGEEFVVVLPDTDSAGAYVTAEHIRRAVELRQIVHEGAPHGVVTLSIGCATDIPQLELPCTRLIERADHALYLAKSAGRNCVRVASPDPSVV